MRWWTISLAFAIVLCSRESAAEPDTTLFDVSSRLGFGGQAHFGGRTDFIGVGDDLDVELGVYVTPMLTLRAGFERGPRLFNYVGYETDGDREVSDLDVVGVAELHIDRWLIGAGGGWVHESSTDNVAQYGDMGVMGDVPATYTRNGEIVLARAGMQLAAVNQVAVNLVMQLSAQRVTGLEFLTGDGLPGPSVIEHAYGASVGLEVGGPAAKTPPVVPEDRSGQWFVGADVGLTDALSGDNSGDNSTWEGAAPRVGLDAGRYVTPSIAIVLDAAGAKAIHGPNPADQLRLTVGAELHHQMLFASAGGGISRYQQDAPGSGSVWSWLAYLGGGVELPTRRVRYRIGAELSTFGDYGGSAGDIFAFTMTFGVRL
jgi:hypothetical protein